LLILLLLLEITFLILKNSFFTKSIFLLYYFTQLSIFVKNFLGHFINFLKSSSPNFVNNLFLDYIYNTFLLFILIYNDNSVSPQSAGYSFFIPDLYIPYTNHLSPTASSYTVECFSIIESLQFITSLPVNNFFIATDSLSCLQYLSFNVFKSLSNSLSLQISSLFHSFTNVGY